MCPTAYADLVFWTQLIILQLIHLLSTSQHLLTSIAYCFLILFSLWFKTLYLVIIILVGVQKGVNTNTNVESAMSNRTSSNRILLIKEIAVLKIPVCLYTEYFNCAGNIVYSIHPFPFKALATTHL